MKVRGTVASMTAARGAISVKPVELLRDGAHKFSIRNS